MTNIEHPERRGVQVNIPTYLITRASTAPAPGATKKARTPAQTNRRGKAR